MKFSISLFLILSAALSLQAQVPTQTVENNDDQYGIEYFGADHGEAEFNIIGEVRMTLSTVPTKDQADPVIRKQMRYMLGLMRSRKTNAAALYPKFTFSTLSVQSNGTEHIIKYNLKAKGVFKLSATEFTFTIPYKPSTIFADSQRNCMVEKNVEDSNFWYHWEPLIKGCPLQEKVHYFTYTAKLNRISNTTQTYPEYKKLVDNNKTIKMTMLFGFSNYDFQTWRPDSTLNDWGIKSFNLQKDFLTSVGFVETVWSKDQILQIYTPKDKFIPYVTEFNLSGQFANIRIRLVLLDTGLNHNSSAFHTFLRNSLAQESVVFYNGHSGIGKNLDLAQIERMRGFKFVFNPNYQILFLGSCVPYAYYTDLFFMRKKTATDLKGTLNLDILSYGQESLFGSKEDRQLTKAIMAFAKQNTVTSYQDIIRGSPNYFFGINGDEDNPTTK